MSALRQVTVSRAAYYCDKTGRYTAMLYEIRKVSLVLSSEILSPNVVIIKAIAAVEWRAAQLGFRKLFFYMFASKDEHLYGFY
jgi:hypothetical protein